MTAVKKGRGRPKKEVSDRTPQFSIRLPARAKVGLHMLARLRNSSLSQAVEYAVMKALRSSTAGGYSLEKLLLQSVNRFRRDGTLIGHEELEPLFEEMLSSLPYMLVHLPEELTTPEEKLFLRAGEILVERQGRLAYSLKSPEYDAFLEDAIKAYHAGETAEEVADRWETIFYGRKSEE